VSDLQALGANVAYISAEGNPIKVGDGSTLSTTTIMRAVFGTPLKAVQNAVPDASGRATRPLEPAEGTRSDIGAVYTMPDETQLFMYYDLAGRKLWTTESPLAPGVILRSTSDGWEAVLSQAADPLSTQFIPTSALDTVYASPVTNGVMEDTVFQSSYVAWKSAKGPLEMARTPDVELAAALRIEGEGNAYREQELFAEADRAIARQRAAIVARQETSNVRLRSQQSIDSSETERANVLGGYVSDVEYRQRAVALIQAANPGLAITGVVRSMPTKDLAAFVKEQTGQAMDMVLGAKPGLVHDPNWKPEASLYGPWERGASPKPVQSVPTPTPASTGLSMPGGLIFDAATRSLIPAPPVSVRPSGPRPVPTPTPPPPKPALPPPQLRTAPVNVDLADVPTTPKTVLPPPPVYNGPTQSGPGDVYHR
jgi:hypothetical protein